jgi:hypothetical protein
MKNVIFTAALILIFTLTSCNNENLVGIGSAQSTSNIKIGFSMKNASASISRIEGVLSRQGYDTLFTNFMILNDSASGNFENVPSGIWHLTVNAYDESNTLKYAGSADVEVFPGETTPVSLTLNPASGSINISVTWGNSGGNLIYNPSFEINGMPSLAGWIINDTMWTRIIEEAPAGEGAWSLWLAPAFGLHQGGTARTYVTGQSGEGVYTFSFYEKNTQGFAWGGATFSQVRNSTVIFSTNITADTLQWAVFSKTFKLNLMPSDTININLFNYSLAVKAGSNAKIDSVTSGILYDGISLIKN